MQVEAAEPNRRLGVAAISRRGGDCSDVVSEVEEGHSSSIVTSSSSTTTMRLSHFIAVLSTAVLASGSGQDTFHESLTLHPLPDGKLSVLFEFTTHFSLHNSDGRTRKLAA